MNVILYVMDCLRADRIHALGYPRDCTPNLDRMCAQGVAFTNAYSNSGWTAPSGASIFSSQHPSRTGIHKMRDSLNADMPWLPETLKGAGYQTVAFSGVYQVSALRGFNRGFDLFEDTFKDADTIQRCKDRGQDSRGDHYCLPLSEDLHVRAMRWLDGRGDSYDPFCMLIWSIDTHEPFRQPDSYNKEADPKYTGPVDGRGRPFSRVRNRTDLQQLIDLYDGSLRYQDEKFGELIAELEKRQLLDETLIIVVGDHGEMFFEHGLAGHGKFPWEEEIRVPMIMRAPQVLPQGKVCDGLAQTIDIAPTILDACGLEPEKRFRGKSLRPLWEDTSKQIHDALVIEVPFPFHREEHARVVRTPDWKYVEYHPPPFGTRVKKCFKEFGRALSVVVRPGVFPILYGHHVRKGVLGLLKAAYIDPYLFLAGVPTRRLFYLRRDPGERKSVLGAEAETAKKLQSFLDALDKATGARGASDAAKAAGNGQSEEEKIEAHLRELGYVDD
ncbi:MAG: sulfatase [Planctomycetes bacterium]|nr:sulfatase [Planctomycetota bacterium]